MKILFKYASLLMAAAMLFSCSGTVDPDNSDPTPGPGPEPGPGEDAELVISSDKTLIQTFGDDFATITVTLGEEVLNEGVTFYNGENKPVEIVNSKFSTTVAGEHQLWASYGTYTSEAIKITAINVEIPEMPEDDQPGSTSFKARVLATEFTTTGCTYCPNMKELFHKITADPAIDDMLVLTACHSGLINSVKDPAFIKTTFDEFAACSGFPYVLFEMYYGFNNYKTPTATVTELVREFAAAKEESAAGIAVTSSLVDGQLVARVSVKAAEDGEYRVGAFLLEDGIYGKQLGNAQEWMHTHDGVIRYIDSKYYNKAGKEMYYGHSIGNVSKGKIGDYVFVWDVDDIWEKGALDGERYGGYYWDAFVEENLHLAIFVTAIAKDDKGNEFYHVSNVVDCPVNGDTPFEYR